MQAGTFEERNMSAWACNRIKELLAGSRLEASAGQMAGSAPGASLHVEAVTSASGDANVYYVRGKKRCELMGVCRSMMCMCIPGSIPCSV